MMRITPHFIQPPGRHARWWRFAGAAIAGVGYAGAQPDAGAAAPILFPPVIVAAAGHDATVFEMPYSTAVLTTEGLARHLPRSLPAALEELSGFMVQKTSTAQGAPYLRGFTGFRTLLLVDGVRLNNSVFREGPNQYWGTIDPFALERLEVIKGPSSVIYGSDAIGGTVNAVSPAPPLEGSSSRFTGRTAYRYASADNSHAGRLEATGQLRDDLGVRLGVTRQIHRDLRAGRGSGVQPHTGFSETGVDGSLVHRWSDHTRLTARWQDFRQDDAWRTHSTIFGSTWQGTRPGSDRQRSLDQHRRLFALQLDANPASGGIDQFHAGLSHQRQEEDQDRLRGDQRREVTGFAVDTLGAFARARSRSRLGRWVYGGEVYHDRVGSHSRRYGVDGALAQVDIQGPVADDATYRLLGGYVENRLPRIAGVDWVLGGRYNHARADARRVRDPRSGAATRVADSWRSLVGSVRGVVNLGSAGRQNLFAGLSEAFRAPNLSDLTRFDIAEGGQIETPAPDLAPEYFVTAEAGWRTRQDHWSASIAWFQTAIRNQIIRTPTGARVDGLVEVTKRNSGAGRVHGLELEGGLKLPRAWTLTGVLTWMEGELDYFPAADSTRLVRAPLSRVMPLTGHLALRWEPSASRTWVEFAAGAAARQDRLAPSDKVDTERIPAGGTPGYGVLKIRAGWSPVSTLSLIAAVENLTDEDYRVHGSGVNEPGRNLVLSADYRF